MAFCENCGNQLGAGEQFCTNCGTQPSPVRHGGGGPRERW
ncbi:zinc-ribbon domain-containing protein [Selenomonas sp. oral taxon 138]|nr:zinc-ribbon domain-containing protein [Selenomonas sp. oral taxon 138]